MKHNYLNYVGPKHEKIMKRQITASPPSEASPMQVAQGRYINSDVQLCCAVSTHIIGKFKSMYKECERTTTPVFERTIQYQVLGLCMRTRIDFSMSR